MPPIVKKLVILAAKDGLVIQPMHQRNQRTLHIKYGSQQIEATNQRGQKDDASIECHGLVGLLTVQPFSYLIVISSRQQVALIRSSPIYVITGVVLIPLSSQSDACKSILEAKYSPTKGTRIPEATASDSGFSDDADSDYVETPTDQDGHDSPATASPTEECPGDTRPGVPRRGSSNVAEDVIGRKGQYGRFAERWFSRKGWTAERRRAQGMSVDDERKLSSQGATTTVGLSEQAASLEISAMKLEKTEGGATTEPSAKPPLARNLESTYTLLPKLLRTTKLLLSSQSFFFSYDLDLTRRLGTQTSKNLEISLDKAVDPLFFWNQWLAGPFIDGAHHTFVLPLMQGFVGQRSFKLESKIETAGPSDLQKGGEATDPPEEEVTAVQASNRDPDFLLTLISRRSIKRPGLRYLRRGIDQNGHAANSVETEQILTRIKSDSMSKIYSFAQIRGSIPLFFSQSPYALKPVPILQHSDEANRAAFVRHFKMVVERYGGAQVVLLVDKNGGEKAIGEKYEKFTQQLNEDSSTSDPQIAFEWFDFHNICRGMKFENVQILTRTLGRSLDVSGTTIEVDGIIQNRQNGIARTNCMDCLDRTNVVQSAFGQRALEQQLHEEGYDVDLRTDKSTQWFNTLWADNGDAISKQYSSTAALKGDYTRTRQRDYRGAINDLGLTLSRYYNNIVNDYFSQAAIDYLLGNVTAQVFEDFEDNMMSRDPSMSIQKVRENAISTSSKIVIADAAEDFVGGWTLLSPRESNTVRSVPLEESILLLTDAALYRVSFDWSNEKVSSFVRVDLRSIIGIMKGTYVTSVLTAAQSDEQRNFGFIVKYRQGKEDIARVNTRSLSSAIGLDASSTGPEHSLDSATREKSGKGDADAIKIIAFKALPTRSSVTNEGQETLEITEEQLVGNVCNQIKRAAVDDMRVDSVKLLVEDGEIVSLREAKKNTGLVEQWGYSLKRMVWG